MSGKTDVQFFYVIGITNENPDSNQSLVSVRVLFDGGADRLPPYRAGANTFYALQHDFVRVQTRFTSLQYDFVCVQTRFTSLQYDFACMQTRFAPCNTISYACKHVLHRCSKRFGGRNDRYIVAANDSGVNMTVTSLQQTIRGSK